MVGPALSDEAMQLHFMRLAIFHNFNNPIFQMFGEAMGIILYSIEIPVIM